MDYLTVTLRGEDYEISYRVVEDDPSTNAFETEWVFFDAPAFELTDAEEQMINLAIGEHYADTGNEPYDIDC